MGCICTQRKDRHGKTRSVFPFYLYSEYVYREKIDVEKNTLCFFPLYLYYYSESEGPSPPPIRDFDICICTYINDIMVI